MVSQYIAAQLQGKPQEQQLLKVSKKARGLVRILNKELQASEGEIPRVIVFVKDRIIACQLKALLEEHIAHARANPGNAENILSCRYKVEMAMGQSKVNHYNRTLNMLNR